MSIINPLIYKPQQPVPAQQQQQYLRPYYHFSTSNTSFISMSNYLKAIGIKNHKFMLVLYDPDLAGVDPFDPALSIAMKAKILKEVQRNFWYFIREVVRVPASGYPQGKRYELNRGNLAYNFCAMYNLNTFFEMPRQVGKTMAAAVRYLWVYNFRTNNASMLFMNKQHPDAKRNLDTLKVVRSMLPSYLQMDQEYSVVSGKKKKLPATVTVIQNPFNHNIIRTCPSARNAMAAANLIRGQTITNLWLDEWAFTKFNDVIYVNGVPALRTAFNNAQLAGAPYGVTITTTAGILATEEGEYAYRMIQNATVFSEAWYDISYEDIMEIIRNNMNSTYVYIRYTYKQLGLGEEWFYNICKDMEWNMVAIRREILLEWIDTPENSPFSQDDLEALRGMVHEPINTLLVLNKYNLNIYDTIEVSMTGVPINPPIIGVDVSGGYKRDYTAISVIDSKTTKYIAGIKCNYMSIPDAARVIIWMVRTMMPNAVVNIERNGGFGASLIAKLKEPGGIKNNLYYEIKDRIIEETSDSFGRVIKRKQRTKVYGLDSSKDVRDLLIEILRERMEMHKDKFNSPVLLDELSKMVVKKNGKVEHSENSHDDLVFSFLMALYVWYEGKNLKENFHINKTTIKTEDSIDDTVGNAELEKKYVEIIEELKLPEDEQAKSLNEINESLKILKQGMGTMFGDFVKKQREQEHEMLMGMLQNKAVKEAYSKYHHIPVEETEYMTGGQFTLPNELFTNFNMDIDELNKKKQQENMNFYHFNAGN